MRIGILHGYELTGSGSNEYTRYLSRALARAGHEVHVFCREPRPDRVAHLSRAIAWSREGTARELFARETGPTCVLHRLPDAAVQPVYLTDRQRGGHVKSFLDLSPDELRGYHRTTAGALGAVLRRHPVDLIHANHLVWQPSVAAACGTPFIVFPHGSSLEYVVRKDGRYAAAARAALDAAAGLVCGSREVLGRIRALHPRAAAPARSAVAGVGVDTSLFRPVARPHRRESIARLAPARGGKTPAQRRELRRRLDAGDFDAVLAYRDAYDGAVPDTDTVDRLTRLPWEEGPILLFAGALTAGKGLHGLLAALPSVLASHPRTQLLVAGSGAYREVLEALVHAIATGNQGLFDWVAARGFTLDRSDLTGPWEDVSGPVPTCPGLAARVHFLGRLDHDRLRHVFPCADLACFPSVVPEAYPLVLMESLSHGVLPVVSDFSGFADGLATLADLLGPEVAGRMRLPTGPGRVPGIAAKLCALLDDPAALAETAALRRVAVEHFDWDVRAREITAVYDRFLHGRSAR